MKVGCSNKKNKFIGIMVGFMLGLVLFLESLLPVLASGFVEKDGDVYEMLYGTPEASELRIPESVEEEDPGIVEEFFSGLVTSLAKQLNNLLKSHDINLSIDGIVFGRLTGGITGGSYVKADFTHFGLEENNPWGIIGATIFYTLRNVCFVVLPIVLLGLLFMELFHNSGAGRARLKELAMHTVYVFGLLFILPYALDLFIYVRDVVLFSVHQSLNNLIRSIGGGNEPGSVGMVDMMIEIQDGRILNALILLASVCAGLFFLVDYIRIALLLTLSFGLFPLIAVMSFWNQKKLSEWSSVFFPNLLVPFIDMLLVLIPTILNALFVRLFGNGLNSVLVGMIILIVMWNVIIVRNRTVKLLGFDGMSSGGGFGQMIETLSHLRPHPKKEDQNKEGAQNTKDRDKAENSYAANHTSTEDEMSPAVSHVVNSDEGSDYSFRESHQTDTDGMLSDMEEDEHPDRLGNFSEIETEESLLEYANGDTDLLLADMEESYGNLNKTVAETEPVYGGHVESEIYETGPRGVIKDSPDASADENNPIKQPDNEQAGQIRTQVRHAFKTAGKVAAGGAFGTIGTFIAGYGGMHTSVGAGIVSAHGGTKLVEGGSDLLSNAPEAIEKGTEHVKEAVLDAYRRDYEVFKAGRDDYDIESIKKEAKKHASQGVKEAKRRREDLEKEAKKMYQEVVQNAPSTVIK